MDIADTTAPKSDQQNYDDYIAGPKTVTITEVRVPGGEQPVEVHLAEFPGRPFKPSKSMRRVLVEAWGPSSAEYAGRRMTLFGDPSVKFGGAQVGGIRISHLSNLDGPKKISLTVTRGKRGIVTIQPLPDAPQPDISTHMAALGAAESMTALQGAWGDIARTGLGNRPELLAEKNRMKAALE